MEGFEGMYEPVSGSMSSGFELVFTMLGRLPILTRLIELRLAAVCVAEPSATFCRLKELRLAAFFVALPALDRGDTRGDTTSDGVDRGESPRWFLLIELRLAALEVAVAFSSFSSLNICFISEKLFGRNKEARRTAVLSCAIKRARSCPAPSPSSVERKRRKLGLVAGGEELLIASPFIHGSLGLRGR